MLKDVNNSPIVFMNTQTRARTHTHARTEVRTEWFWPQDATEENLFRVMEGVRRYRAELSAQDTGRDQQIHKELLKVEQKLLDYLQVARRRGSDMNTWATSSGNIILANEMFACLAFWGTFFYTFLSVTTQFIW